MIGSISIHDFIAINRYLLSKQNKKKIYTNLIKLIILTVSSIWISNKLHRFYKQRYYNPTQDLETRCYQALLQVPYLNQYLKKKLTRLTNQAVDDFYHEAQQAEKQWQGIAYLPKQGLALTELENKFQQVLQPMSTTLPQLHKVSGNIYTQYDESFISFLGILLARSALYNPMHANTLPIMPRMEANLIQLCRSLFNAPVHYGGVITHGGSTSIFEALKTYKFHASSIRKIKRPNVIVPSSIHVAFYKAAEALCFDVQVIPVLAETQQADVMKTQQAINHNTVLLVASAPSFPCGIIDPIAQLGQLALKNNIGLHIDACLGGFLTAFTQQAGITLSECCDFRVPGVTSLSADLHKYGATLKGISILLLGDLGQESLEKHCMQAYPNWEGGFYVTKSMDGSRSLMNISAALATLLYLGESYYITTTKKILAIKEHIILMCNTQVVLSTHITIVGKPELSVIAFESNTLNIHQIATQLNSTHQWDLNLLQNPNRFHLCITAAHLLQPNTADIFCKELISSIQHVQENPNEKASGMAALYCAKTNIPKFANPIMAELAKFWQQTLYTWYCNPQQPDTTQRPFQLRATHSSSL